MSDRLLGVMRFLALTSFMLFIICIPPAAMFVLAWIIGRFL